MSTFPPVPAARAARPIRVGQENVQPGQARVVELDLAHEPKAQEQKTDQKAQEPKAHDKGPERGKEKGGPRETLPVYAVVGAIGGPRVALLGAPRGDEAAAALAATRACERYDAAQLRGSLTVVPVLQPRGQLTRAGKHQTAAWRFPGELAGAAAPYAAFQIFSALAVPADLVVVFTAPPRQRRSALLARVNKTDPFARRLALAAEPDAVVVVTPRPGSLGRALSEVSGHVITWSCFHGSSHLEADAARFLAAWDRLARALGMWGPGPAPGDPSQDGSSARATPVYEQVRWLIAPTSGIVTSCVAPGVTVPARAPLVEIQRLPRTGKLRSRVVPVRAPTGRARLVLESSGSSLVRKGEKLALLAKAVSRPTRGAAVDVVRSPMSSNVVEQLPAEAREVTTGDATLAAGWVEWAALPELGLKRVRTKLDTGARTSALHVLAFVRVGGTDARPLLSLELPPSSRQKKKRRVEARVRDWIDVRDTSGRTERRPVIETTLTLGPFVRRIRITLTNRGDMRFPFLLGRTALGPHVVVHAHRRNLLSRRPAKNDSPSPQES